MPVCLGLMALGAKKLDVSHLNWLRQSIPDPDLHHEMIWKDPYVAIKSDAFEEEENSLGSSSLFALSFDGHLDDRIELLHKLGLAGSLTNKEILLEAFKRWADETPQEIKGDYALTFYNKQKRQLTLCCDPMGTRTIYYFSHRDFFIFSSSLPSLLDHPQVGSKPDSEMLARHLYARLGLASGRTFFKGVSCLQGGEMLTINNGILRKKKFHSFKTDVRHSFKSNEEMVEAYLFYFDQAVKRRQNSRGSTAISLSGGLDSSAIYASSWKNSRDSKTSEPLGLSYYSETNPLGDERAYILGLESKFSSKVEIFKHNSEPFLEQNKQIIELSGIPLLVEQLPIFWQTCEMAKAKGSSTLLTGHWGDQLLSSSAYLLDLVYRFRWAEIPRHLRQMQHWHDDVPKGFFRNDLIRSLLSNLQPLWIRLSRANRNKNRHTMSKILQNSFSESFQLSEGDVYQNTKGVSIHHQSLLYMLDSSAHQLNLQWYQTLSHHLNIHIRFPFLDVDLVQFMLALPGEFQCYGGEPKYLLKKSMTGILPEKILSRKSKGDYSEAANLAMLKSKKEFVDSIRTSCRIADMGYVHLDRLHKEFDSIEKLKSSNNVSTWEWGRLMGLELWARKFC